jgi:hypothetical protein
MGLELLLIRLNVHEGKKFTHGKLFNKTTGEFLMHTLEDQVRDLNADGDLNDSGEEKVYGETAIPYGIYEIFLRESPSRGRVVPQLRDVNHFDYIQIHSGNRIAHSLGCILVGYEKDEDGDQIWRSREAERDLVQMIQDHGGKARITIV